MQHKMLRILYGLVDFERASIVGWGNINGINIIETDGRRPSTRILE